MGYKLLGFVVWKGAKWYMGRRVGPKPKTKVAVAGGALALSAGAAAAVLLLRRGSGD